MDEDKISEIIEKLEEIFGEKSEVKAFSGKSLEDVINHAEKYMRIPIVKIEACRIGTNLEISNSSIGTNLEISNSSINEVYTAVIHIISHALQIFPKEDRNDILFEAIQNIEDKYDEGMLFMEEDEINDDEE